MIVVDVGCMTQPLPGRVPPGEDDSVHKLIERFAPDVLFGFDPHPDLKEGIDRIGDTLVILKRAAAWTHEGQVGLDLDGIRTGVAETSGVPVQSIDFPRWIKTLPAYTGIVLKLDAEGAEYPLLAEIARLGLDYRLLLVLVEWHAPEASHGWHAPRPLLNCPVEEWD